MPLSPKVKAALLIFILTIIVYSNSLGGEFVYDDEYFIVKNIAIRNLANIPLFFVKGSAVAFGGLSKDVYRPLTTVSCAIDYFLWKLNTFGYHLTNAFFHATDAVLLFVLLCLIFGDTALALCASLLFAFHPVQVEAVTWISGRSSVLFLFFYLASFIYYILATRGPRRGLYLLSVSLFAAAVFSKEMAVTLPLLLVVYDMHFFSKDRLRSKVARYAPYFAISFLFVAVKALLMERVSQCGWWGGSPYYTFLTMTKVVVEYIKLLFVPMKLCAFYAMPISRSMLETRVWTSIILLGLLAASLPYIFKKSRKASFAIWWFFVTFLPVSNIIPLKALMAERFLYLPSIGFCILMAVIIMRIKSVRIPGILENGRVIAAIMAIALVAAYSARTIARNEEWQSAVTMSKSIIAVSPLNPWGYTSLGAAYLGTKQYDRAVPPLKKAIALIRDYASPKTNLGFCYMAMGRYEEAIPLLEESLELQPDSLETINSLAISYARIKNYKEAIGQFELSIRLDPTFMSAYMNLGATYEAMYEFDKAIDEYRRMEANTNSAQDIAISYIRIGDVYVKTGRQEEGIAYYRRAGETCGNGFPELKKIILERIKNPPVKNSKKAD